MTSTPTWMDYTPCLDTDYFNTTTLGKSFITTKQTTTNPSSTISTTTINNNNIVASNTISLNKSTTPPPSIQATNLLIEIARRVLLGEDGQDPTEINQAAKRPRSYADSQGGAPVSVSQILRELRRIEKKEQQPEPEPQQDPLQPPHNPIPDLLLRLLEHPLFRPPVGEVGLSFIQQGLLTPIDWDVILIQVQEILSVEDPTLEEEEYRKEQEREQEELLNNTATNIFSKKNNAVSSFITSAVLSTNSRPGTTTGLGQNSNNNNEHNEQQSNETEDDRLQRILQAHESAGHGGGAARLYNIHGQKRKLPIQVNLMQPSKCPKEQNVHNLCLDFNTRRSIRTCSTANVSQVVDTNGPLLGPPPFESLSFLPSVVLNSPNSPNNPNNASNFSNSSSAPFLHKPKSTEHNIHDIPTGSLVALTTKSRTNGMFLIKNHVRSLHTTRQKNISSQSDHLLHTHHNTNAPPTQHDINSGNSALDPNQIVQFNNQLQFTDKNHRLSPLTHPGNLNTTLSHAINPTTMLSTFNKSTVGWFLHSLEMKPNILNFSKIVLNKGTCTLTVRLQNVGINTLRFRIYSQHKNVICTNTTPSGPLAPGMKSIFQVSFAPKIKVTDLGAFKTEILVVSQDEVVKLPIVADVIEKWVDS